jgi:hypothetical protein
MRAMTASNVAVIKQRHVEPNSTHHVAADMAKQQDRKTAAPHERHHQQAMLVATADKMPHQDDQQREDQELREQPGKAEVPAALAGPGLAHDQRANHPALNTEAPQKRSHPFDILASSSASVSAMESTPERQLKEARFGRACSAASASVMKISPCSGIISIAGSVVIHRLLRYQLCRVMRGPVHLHEMWNSI